MCILMGLITEILMRTYFESQGKTSYAVRERLNFDEKQAKN
jgi:dolichol-phosphate mannosyltransferase